jgi:hypothetical protein
VYAAYDHVWWASSKWRTSLYGGYVKFDYNDKARVLISQATCTASLVSGNTGAGASVSVVVRLRPAEA